LDPSINKKQWGLKEDVDFLEKWLAVGNKWREIANLIDGRTESQVKNRFKLILRREHIQQNNYDPADLKAVVIP
jgi:myb proto-oncogene protein